MRQEAYCTRGGCSPPAGRSVGAPGGDARSAAGAREGPRPGWLRPRPRQRCQARGTLGPSPAQRVGAGQDSAASGSHRTPAPLPARAGAREASVPSAGCAESQGGPRAAWPWSVKALQTRLSAQAPRTLCRRAGLGFSGYFCDSWSYRQIWQKRKKPKERHTG